MNGLLFANVAASAAIGFILLFRGIFRERFFAKFFVLLWVLVIIRLLLPFEFSSGLSFYKPIEKPETTVSEAGEILWEEIPEGGIFVPKQETEDYFKDRKRDFSSGKILFSLWISGAVFTGGFFILRHRFSVKRIMADSAPLENVSTGIPFGKTRVFKSRNLCSPLSFGILRPTIVIPENIGEKQLSFVLLHEQTHLLNRDPALKALALFALSVNWFNPAVWFMVKYFDMDMERFCDERVLKILGSEKASAYANTILDFAERESLSLSFFSAASLCERVTSIMKNKNKKSRIPAALMIFLAVALLMTACGTTPAPEKKEPISAGNLSAANSEAENLDKLLQEMVEVKLHEESENLADINPDAVTAEIPGLAEELQGFYGENAPNNYVTDTYSLMQVEKIEKITVTGFYFAEGASASILLVPSNETYVSITYGDVLRENGLFVETNGNEITVSVGTPCEDIREAFDLRIYGDFEGAEIAIDNLPYEVYVPAPPAEEPEKPEITETEDIGFDFVSPVEKGWIAVTFGGYKGHTGTDVSAESGIGTDILAVADGEVVKVKRDNTGYGYHIIINHGNGVQTCYAHCSELLVELGQKVEAGEVVAKMGATGNSTGIHLHFELRINGEYVDPEKYIIF